ncbi:hypothetical protein [Francisella tularensis]|uniref:hypothetical protein n=1 Tax=Francisella tularensis TaxID=263 RepID=UPI000158AE12|nr:hypothetical protein [Francisella tularensis]AJI44673.1 hypothetical protein AS84_1085 [Francisella tularensis subsp. novicida F6168]APC99453.1 hypothetical protein KX03_1470 [Francisella tularensis subsp. novicida]EDN36729.1 predicted protein [Francisella tularensis subsp. novicida GA99-3549]
MKWQKKGLIFKNEFKKGWRYSSALQPTPLVFDDKIRFYVGFRDEKGVSRIGFIDLDKKDPKKILKISDTPVLDIGPDGAFDEFGVVPSAIIRYDNKVYMYYAGYQLGKKVRFLVLSGLAISDDNGETFKRIKKVPIFERTDKEMLFRVPHTVRFEENKFKFWYGGGSHFEQGKQKTLPVYDVRYLESIDGISIPSEGKNIISLKENEYRVGRPFVIKRNSKYLMFYGYSSENKPYQLGYAESKDGINWIRLDDNVGIELSATGWDSEMMAYPCVVDINDKTYLFYNGNNYGADGFGYAELVEE